LLASTFSIVARDPESGDLGVAVASKFFAVGTVVPWLAAGLGAIASQAWANTDFGHQGLALLERGYAAPEALERLVRGDKEREKRQVGMVDAYGDVAHFTGDECLEYAGAVKGDQYTVQGNLLAGPKVLAAMASAYEARGSRPFPERLMGALEAGQEAGGDRRGQQAAALVIVREGVGRPGYNDQVVNLRVDDHERPVEEMQRLLAMHRELYGPGGAERRT
jgi:uncharacterized Ntn-hydrolase superfamily protein